MTRPLAVALLACLALSSSAPAARAAGPSRVEDILTEAPSPLALRARLAAHAEAAGAADAGEAWHAMGWSHWRGSHPDSAILAWRRALALRGMLSDRFDLADALLSRQAPGDVDTAIALIEAALPEAQAQSPRAAVRLQALLAWGRLLAGDLTASRELFESVEPEISREPLWRYRAGRAALTSPDASKALALLFPLAVSSRGQDAEITQMLELAARRLGAGDALEREMISKLEQRDAIEDRVVTRIAGRRIKFAAGDGFPLSGVLLEAAGPRPRTAIVLVAPEDTLSDFDSLAVALRGAGLHTLLLQPRGSGWSVASDCPLPVAWRGREEFMLRRAAMDARDAVRAVRLATRNADTSSVVLVASRSLALSGALAAAQDRRVRALVLLSPAPDPVDRGAYLAALARRPLPVFLSQTPEDFPDFRLNDLAYQATLRSASRVSDGRAAGHGAVAFRQDARVTPRFVQWLAEALAPPARKATPPSPPRKG